MPSTTECHSLISPSSFPHNYRHPSRAAFSIQGELYDIAMFCDKYLNEWLRHHLYSEAALSVYYLRYRNSTESLYLLVTAYQCL